ncbi:MAG: hypothetical protein ABI140_05240 [Jatrophihabitantaceae bacterium]
MTSTESAPPHIRAAALPGELTGSFAPMPTERTIRMRTLLPYQAYRFARVSLKVLRMIRRSHAN